MQPPEFNCARWLETDGQCCPDGAIRTDCDGLAALGAIRQPEAAPALFFPNPAPANPAGAAILNCLRAWLCPRPDHS